MINQPSLKVVGFTRSSKTIPSNLRSKKAWLEIEDDELAPNDLIHLILKARADLLYNGGIGTYIKGKASLTKK